MDITFRNRNECTAENLRTHRLYFENYLVLYGYQEG